MRCLSVLMLSLFYSSLLWAAIDAYEFDDPADQQRFQDLVAELRCPKCQNQNIADSNAPLAADLRQKVYEMIQKDQDNQTIVDYMVQRYGDFVTYRPPLDARTWLLWFGPLGLIAIAGIGLAIWIRRRSREPLAASELSAEEQNRLNQLLQKDNQ